MDEWSKASLDHVLRCYASPVSDPIHPYKFWHANLQARFDLHPSVVRMVEKYKPKDYLQLALEYPHVSEKDSSRLAYTRSDADGANDRQLVTSIGKYLSRHWPNIDDHLRRDAQAAFTPDALVIYDTLPEIIRAIEEGPRSCMASVYGSIPFKSEDKEKMRLWFADKNNPEPDWGLHPYSAYLPEYGWSIATRTTPEGRIDGRALVYKDGKERVFLRTYQRHKTDPTGWSETDFTLREWLIHQGYVLVTSWPEGARLHTPYDQWARKISAPYVDGGCQTVEFDGDKTSYFSATSWTHQLTDTSGFVLGRDQDDEDTEYCPDCDEHYPSDDMVCVGRHEDYLVCQGCRDDNYVWVRGADSRRSFREYYAHENNTDECGNYTIDTEYPPEGVVQLDDGGWAEIDDCVCINGDYYLEDDDDVVCLEENDNLDDSYGLKRYCYEVDGKYWKDEDHYLEFNPPEEVVEDLTTTETT